MLNIYVCISVVGDFILIWQPHQLICVFRCPKSAGADRIFFCMSMDPCTRKKVRPQYIWMRRIVSSIVFPLFLVMLVTVSFTILSLTNFIGNSNNIYDIKDHTNLNISLSNLHKCSHTSTIQNITKDLTESCITKSDNELNQVSWSMKCRSTYT